MAEPTLPEKRPPGPVAGDEPDAPEVALSLADYFGGYAIIFLGVVGLALAFVLITKLMR